VTQVTRLGSFRGRLHSLANGQFILDAEYAGRGTHEPDNCGRFLRIENGAAEDHVSAVDLDLHAGRVGKHVTGKAIDGAAEIGLEPGQVHGARGQLELDLGRVGDLPGQWGEDATWVAAAVAAGAGPAASGLAAGPGRAAGGRIQAVPNPPGFAEGTLFALLPW
jgi:hypothetical protein